MVGSAKDVLIIGGILGIVFIAYKGIGGFMKGLNPLPTLPNPSLPQTTNTNPDAVGSTNQLGLDTKTAFQNLSDNLAGLTKLLQFKNPFPNQDNNQIPNIQTVRPDGTTQYYQGEDGKTYINGILQSSITSKEINWNVPIVNVNPASLDIHSQISSALNPNSGAVASNAIVQTTETAKQKNIPIPAQPTSFKVQGGIFTNSLGFVGGKTTMGDNLVDTLKEVLKIFPNLTASQARNALSQHQGLDPAHFALINPLLGNFSNEGKEKIPQIFGNSSNPIFNGTNPVDISSALQRHLA